MASSNRNTFGQAASPLAATEKCWSTGEKLLAPVQPFGATNGNYFEVTTVDLLHRLGTSWIKTVVDTDTDGLNVCAVQAATASLGPFVRMTNDNNALDNLQLQFAGAQTASTTAAGSKTAWAAFFPGANKDIVMRLRFRVTTVAATDFLLLGLANVDTTLTNTNALATAELLGFTKAAATASMLGNMRTSSTSTTVAAGTVVINTWHTLEMRLFGVSSVAYGFDGVYAGSSTVTNIPVAGMTPSFAVANASTTPASIDIAGCYFGQEVY